VHQALVHLAGRGTRFDRQLPLEHGGAGVVDAQRTGAIVVEGVQTHQLAIRPFVERIVSQAALGVPNRGGVLTLALQERDQPIERLVVALGQPLDGLQL